MMDKLLEHLENKHCTMCGTDLGDSPDTGVLVLPDISQALLQNIESHQQGIHIYVLEQDYLN